MAIQQPLAVGLKLTLLACGVFIVVQLAVLWVFMLRLQRSGCWSWLG
jgi:hypothetical protein